MPLLNEVSKPMDLSKRIDFPAGFSVTPPGGAELLRSLKFRSFSVLLFGAAHLRHSQAEISNVLLGGYRDSISPP